MRILIMGRQTNKSGVDEVVKKSVKELKKTNPQMIGAWIMRKLIDIFYFDSNSVDEYQILENMGNLFCRLGDSVSGDEKLFRYTSASGFVWLCI